MKLQFSQSDLFSVKIRILSLKGSPVQGSTYVCYTLTENINLGGKLAKLTNALAYYGAEFVMAATNSIFHSLGNSVKTFFSSSRNKLEWSCCKIFKASLIFQKKA